MADGYANQIMREVLVRLATQNTIEERMFRAMDEAMVAEDEDFTSEQLQKRKEIHEKYQKLISNKSGMIDEYERLLDYPASLEMLANKLVWLAIDVLETEE